MIQTVFRQCPFLMFNTKKLKPSHYTPRERLGGEELKFLLILDLGN
jgi:hypothetical protein